MKDLSSFGLIDHPDEVAAHLMPAYDLAEAVDGAAYAQESVLELLDVKRRLLQDLEQTAPPDLVIGSSSSGIPASAFAHGLKISSRVLGLCCAVPNGRYLEYIPQLDMVTSAGIRVEKGMAIAPQEPGNGIEWD